MKKIKIAALILLALIVVLTIKDYKADLPIEDLKVKYAHAASKYMDIDGLQVHYRDEGNKSDSIPLVLIHGTSSSLHTWDDCTEKWKENHRVIRFDIPGFGLTGPNKNNDYSFEQYSKFIGQVLERLNVDSCTLIGNSLGGNIAWRYAYDHPEKASRLVLLDASGYKFKTKNIGFLLMLHLGRFDLFRPILTHITPTSILRKSVENVYFDTDKITDLAYERYMDFNLREGNRLALIERLQVPVNASENKKKIQSINIPTLIIWGDHDVVVPIKCAYDFQEDLPNNELYIVENSGHVPMEENPEEIVKVVDAFLAK